MVDGIAFLRLMHGFKSIKGGKKGICGLNITELFCVMLIKECGERGEKINLSDISRELDVSKPAVSQLVNKLEWKRIIRRVRNKDDKKIINLEITPRAQAIFKKHSEKHSGLVMAISSQMGDDLDVFMQCSQKILNIIQNYYKNTDLEDEE